MSLTSVLNNTKVRHAIHTVTYWSPLWIGITILFVVSSIVYAYVLKKDTWLASQSLIVRNEAIGTMMKLGRFESSTQMKAAQETIADMCRNPQVIRTALLAAGPESSLFGPSKDWPSNSDIKEFANSQLSLHAPRGAEFGATEVVYLDVKHNSPERAVLLNVKVCEALEEHLRKTRESRAESVLIELAQSRDVARQELTKATRRLQDIEKTIGADLPDLRSMVEAGGNSTSRTTLDQVRLESRQLKSRHEELLVEFRMLEAAASNPEAFISTPGSLLNSQPGLKRLREGLVDAQLSLSQLSGRFTENHPAVSAGRTSIEEITTQLNLELQAVVANARQELVASEAKMRRALEQEKEMEQRLDRLAESRAIYANIVSDVKTRANILENAERELAEVEASRLTSLSSSVLSRNGEPTIGDKPIGPGRSTIVGVCSVAGLVCGLGLTFLISPLANATRYGRRWNDSPSDPANQGRRASDRADAYLATPTQRQPAAQTASIPTESKPAVRPYGSGGMSSIPNKQTAEEKLVRPIATHPKTEVRSGDSTQPLVVSPMPAGQSTSRDSLAQLLDTVEAEELQELAIPTTIGAITLPSNPKSEVFDRKPISTPVEQTVVLSEKELAKDPTANPNERRQRPRKAPAKPMLPLNFALRDTPADAPASSPSLP